MKWIIAIVGIAAILRVRRWLARRRWEAPALTRRELVRRGWAK